MTNTMLQTSYYNWMCQLVYTPGYSPQDKYTKLLSLLYLTPFEYTNILDGNRESDGVNLRYHYGYLFNVPSPQITVELDTRPCSVLEMMIALACKCEDIFSDMQLGNRTGQWFWEMIWNLGLISYDDTNFDELHVRHILRRFFTNTYSKDGSGSLFRIINSQEDLRNVDIWTQMHWYMNAYHNEISESQS